jgi:hypothetical protein
MFWRNILPPSSGFLWNTVNHPPDYTASDPGCLLGLLFDPEDGDNAFLLNIRKLPSQYSKR